MAAYILGIVCIGSLFARRQKSAADFFLANRRFKWLPIALSVIASDLSAISYMGAPAMSFQHDLRYAVRDGRVRAFQGSRAAMAWPIQRRCWCWKLTPLGRPVVPEV